MATYGRSRASTASPSAVWRVWSDPDTWHEWNPNVRRMTMHGPFADGTTGEMATNAGRTHAITLANVQPGRSFEVHTSVLPLTRFTFHCEVAASGPGSTVSQSVSMSGPLAPVFGPLAGERIAASFEPLLEGLARKAEAAQR